MLKLKNCLKRKNKNKFNYVEIIFMKIKFIIYNKSNIINLILFFKVQIIILIILKYNKEKK